MAKRFLDRELFQVEARHVILGALGLLFLWGAYLSIVGYPSAALEQVCDRLDALHIEAVSQLDALPKEAKTLVSEMDQICRRGRPLKN